MIHFNQQNGAQLPEEQRRQEELRLRRAQRVNAVMNHGQSIGETTVERFLSQAVAALRSRYAQKDLTQARNDLINWVNNLKDIDATTNAAKRCIARFEYSVYSRHNINMQQALGLVWLGIHDPRAQASEKAGEKSSLILTETDFADRRKRLIQTLYEIERNYNMDVNGRDNGEQQNGRSCEHGSINKLIATLSGGHDDVHFLFVNAETISQKANALLIEHFLKLEDKQKIAYAQAWKKDGAPPDTLINTLKSLVERGLHQEFDGFFVALSLNQMISTALANLEYINPPRQLEEILNPKVKPAPLQKFAEAPAMPPGLQPPAPVERAAPVLFTPQAAAAGVPAPLRPAAAGVSLSDGILAYINRITDENRRIAAVQHFQRFNAPLQLKQDTIALLNGKPEKAAILLAQRELDIVTFQRMTIGQQQVRLANRFLCPIQFNRAEGIRI